MPEWAQRSLGFLRMYAGFITGTAVAVWFSSLADISLAVVLFLVILVLFFKIAHCRENAPGCKVLYLVFLFVIIVTVSYFVAQQRYSVLSFTPFAAMSMAVALLFNDLIISFMVTVAAAVIIAALNGGSFYLGLLSLVSGLAASLLFHGARRRNTIIRRRDHRSDTGHCVVHDPGLSAFVRSDRVFTSQIVPLFVR
jgi:membrane-associated HD superfamily phosphohydrolase